MHQTTGHGDHAPAYFPRVTERRPLMPPGSTGVDLLMPERNMVRRDSENPVAIERRARRRALPVVAIAIIVLVGLLVVLPRFVDLHSYRGQAADTIQQATGGSVALAGISWGIDGGLRLELDGLEIRDARGLSGDIETPRRLRP